MRRVAALYDIHGNLPALRAVLAEIEATEPAIDHIVIGGDVANGPLPAGTIDELMALQPTASFVMGNGDREIIAARDGAELHPAELDPAELENSPAVRGAVFAANRISQAQRDFLTAFEPTLTLQIDGLGEVLFCHGSPRSDTEIITPLTPDSRLRPILANETANAPAKTIVAGHTHRQFDRTIGDTRLVNAGSVGMPYEGRAAAFWAILGPDVELRHTNYDIAQALAELRAGGFPDTTELLQESLITPMPADEVSKIFEDSTTRA